MTRLGGARSLAVGRLSPATPFGTARRVPRVVLTLDRGFQLRSVAKTLATGWQSPLRRLPACPTSCRTVVRWARPQFVIGRFIPRQGLPRVVADFAAPSPRLVVEVEGDYHAQREAADARRNRALACACWRVVRLPANLVLRAPRKAARRIQACLA